MKQEQIMKGKNASEQMRVVRGYAIISKGDVPQKIDENTFMIPSQNDNGEYTITNNKGWKCNCPDFEKRHKNCKHIHAVKFYLDFNKKVKIKNQGRVGNRPSCPYSLSLNPSNILRRIQKYSKIIDEYVAWV